MGRRIILWDQPSLLSRLSKAGLRFDNVQFFKGIEALTAEGFERRWSVPTF
jgi:hypothetical protein